MAVNYLEMNDSPERFDYFKRFIDVQKYEEQTIKYRSGRAQEEKAVEKLKQI